MGSSVVGSIVGTGSSVGLAVMVGPSEEGVSVGLNVGRNVGCVVVGEGVLLDDLAPELLRLPPPPPPPRLPPLCSSRTLPPNLPPRCMSMFGRVALADLALMVIMDMSPPKASASAS